ADLKAFARSAVIEIEDDTLYVDLEDVEPLGPNGEWTGHAGRMSVTVPLSQFVTPSSRKFVSERYQTSKSIKQALRAGTVPEEQVDRYKYELHRRYATASTLLLFLLLGAPTGIMLRRGTQLGALAVAVVYALVYYVLSLRVGKELARDGTIPPEIGAWATIGMGTVLSIVLVHKAFRR
ncbi:MAG: lipopolysaccharide export LptBFGC system permease protein LptF, partial [Planctomycetota bacterium]